MKLALGFEAKQATPTEDIDRGERMRPEEFKTYLSGTVLLTRSQISALKAMCDREIATRDELIVQRMAEQRS